MLAESRRSLRDDLQFAIPEHLQVEIRAQLAARPLNSEGTPLCTCGLPIGEHEFLCSRCAEQDRRERAERDRCTSVHSRVGRAVEQALAPAPRWAWARASEPDFVERVGHPRLQGAAARWLPSHGPLTLIGQTGSGKTATVVAIVHRLADAALADAARGDASTWRATSFLWTNGADLATARRRHPLGAGESPLVTIAGQVPVLVVDELGFETVDTTIGEIVDARYRAALPIIVTSGLTVEGFRGRYGDAIWRKLAQRGTVIDAGGAGG